MSDSITELENLIVFNLQTANKFKNEVEKKENEKIDQLKEISLGVIDIIDSFELIEESLIEKGMDQNEQVSKTLNRYKTIQKKLLNLLQKYGISKIEFPDNRVIVGLCEVVETEVHNDKKNDEIITIVRHGYIRGKELIRAAQIIIVKN
ncbi:nucleotide exchange factor GrpE [Chitinophagaceae bacterium IBVUCB2]|nr:nucleotide exchange factor GrpE [Chitinophagaceae bacterium IBVUCB2]